MIHDDTRKTAESRAQERSKKASELARRLGLLTIQLGEACLAPEWWRWTDTIAALEPNGLITMSHAISLATDILDAMHFEHLEADAIKHGLQVATEDNNPSVEYMLECARKYKHPGTGAGTGGTSAGSMAGSMA